MSFQEQMLAGKRAANNQRREEEEAPKFPLAEWAKKIIRFLFSLFMLSLVTAALTIVGAVVYRLVFSVIHWLFF